MKGLVTVVATGGVLAATGYAYADSTAAGAAEASPGLLAGNAIQLPVDVPVNACGNTVDVLGLLNPAAGNTCANESSAHHGDKHADKSEKSGSSNSANGGGASAQGEAKDSPGVLSGNGLQLPIDLPVNISGNSVSVVGIGNPAFGNKAVNHSAPRPDHPAAPTAPPVRSIPAPPAPAEPAAAPVVSAEGATLAHTGSDGLGFAAPASAVLLAGGSLLYRRFRNVGR
ncbi:chaplin [Streptomyces sp. NPDC006692]|uniref:chaplin n=1 Tax=Streptomyces sp. NPDC006692 TaxID=3364758 RepID=UPI00368C47F5